MTETQPNPPFETVITKDGSPSLAFFKDGFSQMMHSSQGAYAETEFVYGKALDLVFKTFESVDCLSVGLGFGYVELSAFVRAKTATLQLISYEKEARLRTALLKFIEGKNSEFDSCYEKIFSMYSKEYNFDEDTLKSFFKGPNFQLRETLIINSPPKETFNCILFDPFCSKFSPEFWTESDLNVFLQTVAQEKCVFATYAATGALSRSLKAAGFKKLKHKGFAGKREFTLATKNI